jgi:hypothetical protein
MRTFAEQQWLWQVAALGGWHGAFFKLVHHSVSSRAVALCPHGGFVAIAATGASAASSIELCQRAACASPAARPGGPARAPQVVDV